MRIMTQEVIKKATDEDLGQLIKLAQAELKDRAEKRRADAISQIKKLALAEGLQVSFEKKPTKAPLKAGAAYTNPANTTQRYVVGNGRPPQWFEDLRAKGQLPAAEQKT